MKEGMKVIEKMAALGKLEVDLKEQRVSYIVMNNNSGRNPPSFSKKRGHSARGQKLTQNFTKTVF